MKVGAKFTSEGIMFGFFFVLDNRVLVFRCACMDQFATTANSHMNPAFLSLQVRTG